MRLQSGRAALPIISASVLALLTVANSAAQPHLLVGPSALEFGAADAATPPAPQTVFVASNGDPLPYEVKTGYWSIATGWLSVTSASGTTPATLILSVDAANLPGGVYFGYVEITSGTAQPTIVPVTLRVGDPAAVRPDTHVPEGMQVLARGLRPKPPDDDVSLVAEPSALTFSLQSGESMPPVQTVSISSSSGRILNYTASADFGSWLAVGPQSGSTSGSNIIAVAVNPANLAAGTRTGYISVAAPGVAQALTIPITLDAAGTGVHRAAITVDKNSISLQGTLSGPVQTGQIQLSASPSESFSISTSPALSWLSVTPVSGSAPATLAVTADPSVLSSPNTYSGTILINGATSGLQFVGVTFVVTGTGGITGITATPSSFSFTPSTATSQTVQVTSTSSTSISASSNSSWLTVTPTSGTTPATLTLSVNPSGLVPGTTYPGSVTIIGGGTSVNIPVSYTVPSGSGNALTANPASLTFTPATATSQTVQLTSTASTSFNASSNSSWLTVNPASGTATPATLTLSVSAAGLAPGITYHGSVTVIGGGTSVTILVDYTVPGTAVGVITVSPTSVSFVQTLGGATPASQTVQLSSTTSTSFSAASNASWLTVTPISGTTPATLTLSVNATGLTAGTTYQGLVTLTGGATTVTVPVTFTINSGAANGITATPSSFTFSQTLGGTAPASQTVQLSSATSTSFTAASTATWLTVTPTSGTSGITPATLTLSVNAAGLTAGTTYQGSVTIIGGATTLTIPVSFTVSSAAANAITATPSSFTFSQTLGGATPASQTVQLSSATATSFTAASNTTWLTVTPTSGTSGTSPATLTLSVNAAGLAAGTTYQGSVTITGGATTVTLPVSFLVLGTSSSTITANPLAIVFTQIAGQNSIGIQSIQLSATTPTNFAVSNSASWLTVTPTTGTTPATLTLSANTSALTPGTYSTSLTITGGVAAVSVPVMLTVAVAANSITATPASATFTQIGGGPAPSTQTIKLDSANPTAFSVATTSTWLTVAPTSGTTPATLTLTVNPAGLAIGSYQDTITITGGAATVTIPVALTVSSDTFVALPASLSFKQTVSGSAPSAQTVQLSSSTPRNYIASTSVTWLSASPSIGITPATLTVTANGAGLAVGTYQSTITVNGAGAPLSIPVTLTVSTSTGAILSPSTLAFTYAVGDKPPATQTVSVSSPGSDFAFTATATATNNGTWLSVTPANGTTPATLTVTATPTGLATGKYSGIITVTPTDTSIPTQTIPVTLTVGSGSSSLVFVRSILNAASLLPGPVAPGEIITVTGTGLGPVVGAGPNLIASGSVDTQVAGTRLLFDGIPAPLLFVRADQINAVVPYNVYGRTGTNMQVEITGVRSDPIGLRVDNTAPATFTIDGSGRGQASIINQDGTINSASSPAPRGSIVAIYGTGEGQTSPAGQDGRIITSDLRTPLAPVTVKIGGVPVEVRYVGSAPGAVSGLFQLNVLLPNSLVPGPQSLLEIRVGDGVSQSGATIAVK